MSFAEQLYLLSTVLPFKNRKVNRINQRWLLERMRLLDGIALLLCTGAKKEAAAVTFETTGAGTKLFYCKNRPCDVREKSYISGLLEIVQNAVRYEDCVMSIMGYIIPECRGKIKSRLGKVACEILSLQNISPDGKVSFKPSENFERHIRLTLKNSVPDDMPIDIFLQVVMDFMEKLPLENSELVADLMEMAHFIGLAKDVHIVIPHPVLVWRLKKFGEFFAAAKHIAWMTLFDRDVSSRKKLITITEVSVITDPFILFLHTKNWTNGSS